MLGPPMGVGEWQPVKMRYEADIRWLSVVTPWPYEERLTLNPHAYKNTFEERGAGEESNSNSKSDSLCAFSSSSSLLPECTTIPPWKHCRKQGGSFPWRTWTFQVKHIKISSLHWFSKGIQIICPTVEHVKKNTRNRNKSQWQYYYLKITIIKNLVYNFTFKVFFRYVFFPNKNMIIVSCCFLPWFFST